MVASSAFVSMLPMGPLDWKELMFVFLLGPGIATPLGQYAGMWSQWVEGELPHKFHWRFGIRQLLIVTTVLALGLALLKLSMMFSLENVTWLTAWFAYQWVTLHCVGRFCRWRHRRAFEGGRDALEGEVGDDQR